MFTRRFGTTTVFALGLVLAAGCVPISAPPSVQSQAPASVSAGPSVAGQACIRFDPPLVPGSEIGTPSGLVPGDHAFDEEGIRVTVEHFEWTTGPGTMDFFVVRGPDPAFGTDQYIFVNNINLVFDFSGLGYRPQRVLVHFRDQGGNENIAINGDPDPPLADDISGFPPSLGGANLVVSALSASGVGDLEIRGTVDKLTLGGQELSLDDVCAYAS